MGEKLIIPESLKNYVGVRIETEKDRAVIKVLLGLDNITISLPAEAVKKNIEESKKEELQYIYWENKNLYIRVDETTFDELRKILNESK